MFFDKVMAFLTQFIFYLSLFEECYAIDSVDILNPCREWQLKSD